MVHVRQFVIAFGLTAVIVGPAWSSPAPPAGRTAAVHAELRGDWNKAAEYYTRLLADDGRSPELRSALLRCARRAEQARRLADPCYRRFAESLTIPHAAAIYTEVLTRLQQHYWDRAIAEVERLFEGGLDELSHLPDASALTPDLAACRLARPEEVAEARESVKALALAGRRLTGLPAGLFFLEAACGACAALDEYTLYLHPGRDDELAELGLMLARKDQHLVVERVQAGSWAATAALRPGDRVKRSAAADEDCEDIEVQSPGESPRLVRLPPTPPAVAEAGVVTSGRVAVGYLRISHFGKNLPIELDSALLRLRSEGARAVVIDLRSNPGGMLAAAVAAAERFLPRGVVVTARGQPPSLRTYAAFGPASWELPVVLVVDAGSASAAEAFAAALKENGRATLVGVPTYGKAALQQVIPLETGGGVRLTLAHLFGPAGRSFHGTGVAPTIVELDPGRQLEVAVEEAARLAGTR